ncbi:unnamed protein product [Aspergillus oryzae]|uniref:Unnamed protein product n=2 Tax=Aspergillus oryzae TaxID=5062 RepID=A0AAN4YD43_ASPOZ|nr:unnamed protein product [Aspergillus oryzae]GMF91950.1 unnamed protein product [Aspergillus oryzae]GMG27959.1 unnamed protein product [Aspergillus oryzae]GMG48162.1 unnamed protein product [Aspergillus oryzae var. brunneus]
MKEVWVESFLIAIRAFTTKSFAQATANALDLEFFGPGCDINTFNAEDLVRFRDTIVISWTPRQLLGNAFRPCSWHASLARPECEPQCPTMDNRLGSQAWTVDLSCKMHLTIDLNKLHRDR